MQFTVTRHSAMYAPAYRRSIYELQMRSVQVSCVIRQPEGTPMSDPVPMYSCHLSEAGMRDLGASTSTERFIYLSVSNNWTMTSLGRFLHIFLDGWPADIFQSVGSPIVF